MTRRMTMNSTSRKAFWTAVAFYILIGFEFLYMAGPFAAYFYAVYRPGLSFFNEFTAFSWLTRFFLPHIATDTSSALINRHNMVGAVIAVCGFAAFCVGAGQVYYHKLAKKGPVTGGIYRFIRHPQYASFAACGFGLLLLWPRYIVLIMYVTMLFGYYGLAKVEERECEERFGESYRDYARTTSMFFPVPAIVRNVRHLPVSGPARIVCAVVFYAVILALSIKGAGTLEGYALNSLTTHSTADAVTISVVRMDQDKLLGIINTALANGGVKERLSVYGSGARYLNYVLPSEWFISEVPMQAHQGAYHAQPGAYDRNLFKIIFTKVDMRMPDAVGMPAFIRSVTRRYPVVEAWVNVRENRVIKVVEPPANMQYEGIPVALY